MRTLHAARGALAPAALAALFVLSLSATLAVGLVGGAAPLARGVPGLVLASSSSPFAGSSPATTLVPGTTTTTAAPSSAPTAAHTGEAWASRWFSWLLGLSALAGVLTLWPTLRGRRRPARRSVLSAR